jgi:hypothetical protein
MDMWKPGVVYLKGPGLLRSLRSVRIRLHSPAAPDEEDLERRGSARGPVRFMWDYCAYPLWDDTPLSTELESSLQAWSDEGTERFTEDLNGVALPEGWVVEWSDRGRALAHEVALVVGEVEYHNEATGEVERITPPPTP